MSLEHRIEELTVSVKRLIEVLEQQKGEPVKKSQAKKKVAVDDSPPPVKPEIKVAAEVKQRLVSDADRYAALHKLALRYGARHGRQGLTAVFQQYGISRLNELKPEQYEDFASQLDSALV